MKIYRLQFSRPPADAGEAHRMMALMAHGSPAKPRWVLDGQTMTVVSEVPLAPDSIRNRLQDVQHKPYAPQVHGGQRLTFRVRVCPIERHQGRFKRALAPEEVPAFMDRLARRCGFMIEELSVQPEPTSQLVVKGPTRIKLHGMRVGGVLVVEDEALFQSVLFGGIGHYKTWGFGLLQIAAV